MKIKEIKNLTEKKLVRKMTDEEYERMKKLDFTIEQFLEALQESARLSNQADNEEHTTISDYLDYLEDMRNSDNNL